MIYSRSQAIWTMAYGLHSMQQSLCPDSKELCKEMIPVNGSVSFRKRRIRLKPGLKTTVAIGSLV